MTNKIKHIVITFVMVIFFFVISLFAWLKPSDDFSLSERRKLSQFPELSFKTIVSGDFMSSVIYLTARVNVFPDPAEAL